MQQHGRKRHYIKQKKTGTNEGILYDSTYMESKNRIYELTVTEIRKYLGGR